MDKFGLIGGGHHHEAGEVGKVGNVEASRMGCSVSAHEARAVDGEPDGQLFDGDIVNDLVVTALEEGRVHRAKGFHAAGCQTCREGDTVLFRDADVETAASVALGEEVEAGAVWHRCGHGADLVVFGGLGCVAAITGAFGGSVAFALFCHDME